LADVSVLLGNGDGTLQTAVNYHVGPGPISELTSMTVGDFNGDGKLDIVTDGGVLLGNGDGTFQAAQNSRPLRTFPPTGFPWRWETSTATGGSTWSRRTAAPSKCC
jgi:hypothetical protein